MLLSEREARRITRKLLSCTTADDAVVHVNSESLSHLRFAANAFTTSGVRENVTAQITVWIDRKRGSASVNELDDASLRAAVGRAEDLARVSPIDVEYLPTLGPQKYRPVKGYAEATARIAPEDRGRTVNQAIEACEKAKVIGAGFYQVGAAASAMATKNGNFSYERSTIVSFAMTARTPDGGSSGYFLRNHFDVTKFDPKRVIEEAIRKALESREPRTLDAGVYPVILEPQAVADLTGGFLMSSFDARRADEGRSAFSAPGGKTRLGEKVFDGRLNIYSDPWHPLVPGSQEAQDGLPAEMLYLVRNGVVENLVYSRFWAQKTGKAPTPGPVNTLIESSGPTSSLAEMIRSMDRGLLVSRFWYIRMVDPRTVLLTGLTRDGVWLVENGRIACPVRNFRFNQSIIEMLADGNIDLIGASERAGGSESQGRAAGLFPPLKLRAFHFTSQSEAV
ncbi:MAG TPA: TldD/PmbA family protein [Verrucomicrobia bacterium]|nr:TldD/PmbA family protein [Verrucomicrobiota bacterium]HOB33388.1 TldD/PmbA family protein [Verrucomicrobiota bacterium]HOP98454.1 TldD/PmbA family protein [Verrucomicrobiota bacterium]